jgi:hypothetical protein
MKKRSLKKGKLTLSKETLAKLQYAVGGLRAGDATVVTDTDGDTFPSGGGDICWISDCNPCPSQICTN